MLISFLIIAVIFQFTITALFEDFGSLVAFVPVAAAFIFTQLLKINIVLNDTWKKIVTLIIAIAFSFLANILQWGIFAQALWWHLLLYGVLAGLIAMGIFQFEWAKLLLQILGLSQSKDKYNKLYKKEII